MHSPLAGARILLVAFLELLTGTVCDRGSRHQSQPTNLSPEGAELHLRQTAAKSSAVTWNHPSRRLDSMQYRRSFFAPIATRKPTPTCAA